MEKHYCKLPNCGKELGEETEVLRCLLDECSKLFHWDCLPLHLREFHNARGHEGTIRNGKYVDV